MRYTRRFWPFCCVAVFALCGWACEEPGLPRVADVEKANATPVADAGADREIIVGTRIALNGAGSSDLEGARLTYHWEIVRKPSGSNLILIEADQQGFEFVPDRPGLFIFQLHVNDGQLNSAPDQVIVTALNQRPFAKPVFFGIPEVGRSVSLDGSRSSDGDGHELTFHWQIISKPDGSQSDIANQLAVKTELRLDATGVYVLHLLVTDGFETSEPAIIVIDVSDQASPNPQPTVNLPPVAEAGKDILIHNPGVYALDGSASYDPNNDGLFYKWELIAKPPTSQAHVMNGQSSKSQLSVDIRGDYVVQLVVRDTLGLSHSDTVVVTTKHGGLFCADCHNGTNGVGDEAHPSEQFTYSDCGRCHSARFWYMGSQLPGSVYSLVMDQAAQRYKHDGVVSGCAKCHGKFPQKIFARHPVTSSRCQACHTKFSWKTSLRLEHTKALGTCRNCHDYLAVHGHVPTEKDCQFCHVKTDWTSLYGSSAHETTYDTLCFDCHIDTNHYLENTVHNGTSDLCERCHSKLDWLSVFIDHTQYANDCSVCHSGNFVPGKPDSHIQTTELCHACHAVTHFSPVLTLDESQRL